MVTILKIIMAIFLNLETIINQVVLGKNLHILLRLKQKEIRHMQYYRMVTKLKQN